MFLNPKNINRFLNLISAAALIWVGYKLWAFQEWDSFINHLGSNKHHFAGILILQTTLMGLNISLEARKWQILVRPVSRIPFKESLTQVIKGIQLGMVTPARSGDPVGKSLFYKSSNRGKIIVLSLAGSLIQNFVILVAALWALIWITHPTSEYLNFLKSSVFKLPYFIWAVSAMTVLTITGWLILKKYIITRPNRLKIKQHIRILKQTDKKSLIHIFILTLFRYVIFSVQFLILLHFFGLSNIRDGLYAIFLFYAALSFIPSAGSGDLSIRATLAMMIFGTGAIAEPGIVMASLLLWFFNLALPALLPSIVYVAITLHPRLKKYSLYP
ncbi:MAG: hypothetical protein ACOC10_05335 [Bacteroidota bacterium]